MEQLDDLAARHASHLHRYGTYTANQIKKITDKIDRKLSLEILDALDSMTPREQAEFIAGRYTTRRTQALRDNINTAVKETRQAVSTVTGNSSKDLVKYELSRSEKVIAAIPVMAALTEGYKALSPSGVYKTVAAMPIKGVHAKDLTKDIATRYQRALYSQIRDGMVNGEQPAVILSRVRGTAAQLKKDGVFFRRNTDVEAFVRTSMTHASAATSEAAYADMGVKKIVYRATLDGRTSKRCASLDGRVMKVGEGPRPPQHINCRSEVLPYQKDMDWKRPSVSDKRPVGKIPKDERGKKIKQVAATKNYKKWFDEQPVKFKREWLGPSRYKLYKEGIGLDRFTDPRGKEYNLDWFEKHEAQAFKDAGL